ncbi:uncharacterized protein LOC110615362 [Manihot esculenta]|uniref:uncharacterized protein LOC110615362 n=1 Tax=Manihot esculenta TaxID=3983 RepID=UPI000B5D3A09|nr:uncharacterized protein LOC110615362 [Manihot esculenta]
MPNLATYDGTGNPQEHILNYKTFMELQTHSDALMYKVFPITLTGPVQVWFNSLESRSIRNFIDLANVFISRFIDGVPVERKASYLETVRQRRNESLREYIARKPPTTLSELMKRAKKYIRQYDALTTSRFAQDDRDRGRAWDDRRQDKLERRQDRGPEALNKHRWERKEQRPYQPRFPAEVTPLNVSRDKVLITVQDKDFVQWPKPMRAEASKRDPDKYCQYHRTHDHEMNDYYQLINEIERLIKRGHLRNFVKNLEEQRPQQGTTRERLRRQIGAPINDGSNRTINMIVGEIGGHMSRWGKKRRRNENESSVEVMQVAEHTPMAISFSSEDAQGVQMPHDDALVIEAVIHNFRVRKRPSPSQRERRHPDSSGRQGESGPHPRRSTHVTDSLCSVHGDEVTLELQCNSGKADADDFEVVTRIQYLTMKFPTDAGVGVVRGRQEEVKVAYLAIVEEQCV